VRGGGVGEIVVHDETGYVAGIDDPRDMAAGIERLAADAALRETLGRAGRRRAETTYSLQSCAAGVMRVYQMAMSRPLGAVN
jgi:glycosyltransferase involved in cell wall biosynthesis